MDCAPVQIDQVAKLNIMLGALLSVNYGLEFNKTMSEESFNSEVKFIFNEFKTTTTTTDDPILKELFMDRSYLPILSQFYDLDIVEKAFMYSLNQYKKVCPQTLEEIIEEACFVYIKIHIGCIIQFSIDHQIFIPNEYMDDHCLEMFAKFRKFRESMKIINIPIKPKN